MGRESELDLVNVDSPNHTVRNFVLTYAGERTILVRHADFSYHWKGFRQHEIPAWLYVNSLGPDALTYQDEIVDWLDAHPKVRLAFQPGTFQVDAGTQRLSRMYERADVLLCSRTAASDITGLPVGEVDETLDALRKLGSHSAVVFDVTGDADAANDTERLSIEPFPEANPIVDATGTGDAFAATLVAALVRGVSLREALRWAGVNASSVSRHFGTQDGLLRVAELIAQLEGVPTFVGSGPWRHFLSGRGARWNQGQRLSAPSARERRSAGPGERDGVPVRRP